MVQEQSNPARQAAIERAEKIMEDPAIKRAVEVMEWEGGIVVVRNSRFPEVRGRRRLNPASQTAAITDPLLGQPR